MVVYLEQTERGQQYSSTTLTTVDGVLSNFPTVADVPASIGLQQPLPYVILSTRPYITIKSPQCPSYMARLSWRGKENSFVVQLSS